MKPADEHNSESKISKSNLIGRIFNDPEAKGNIVGLFNLLLKIDRRINPEIYQPPTQASS